MLDAAPPGKYLPCSELVEVLLPAYAPCMHLGTRCADARWIPSQGHAPRGFLGALGALADVELVLVAAEPGDPLPDESHPTDASPMDVLAAVTTYVYGVYANPATRFQVNMRYILDLCWPGQTLEQQLRRVWITDSVLCSAAVESGGVPGSMWRQCGASFLTAQLDLVRDRPVVALGRKAADRMERLGIAHHPFGAAAPPGCNFAGVRDGWSEIPMLLHKTDA